jgi:hypothetical protein
VKIGPQLRDIDLVEDLRHYAAHPGKNMPRTQSLIDKLT